MEVRSMTLRIPVDQAAALEVVARVDDMPVSEAVRSAIEAHIEARRGDAAFQARLEKTMNDNRQVLERLARGPSTEAELAQRAVRRAKEATREYA